MQQQKVQMNEIQYTHIEHDGICYKNTTIGPASAEEIACVQAGVEFLVNSDGQFWPDDKAIFANVVVSDGDTIPDIGHFIKCISNGFYTFKTKKKQFGGDGLLDPGRICSISSDVSRHLRSYSNEKKAILSNTTCDSEDKKNKN